MTLQFLVSESSQHQYTTADPTLLPKALVEQAVSEVRHGIQNPKNPTSIHRRRRWSWDGTSSCSCLHCIKLRRFCFDSGLTTDFFKVLPLPAAMRPDIQPCEEGFWKVGEDIDVESFTHLWQSRGMKRGARPSKVERRKARESGAAEEKKRSKTGTEEGDVVA